MINENWFSIIFFEHNVFRNMPLGINKEIDVSVLAKMICMTEFSVDIKHVMQFKKLGCSAWATTFRIDTLLCNGSEQSYFLKVNSTRFGSNFGNKLD